MKKGMKWDTIKKFEVVVVSGVGIPCGINAQ